MNLMVNPVITDFQQDVNGDIKMLKIGANKEDAYANIIEQGGADLDNNKAVTINVSTYTDPVEITPTSGKDGMKKATVTLSNIPSPSGVTTLYAWVYNEIYRVYTTTATPTTSDVLYIPNENGYYIYVEPITEVGEGTVSDANNTYSRYSEGDITF